ncbi:MAG: hypothetical protein R3Y18_00475, partial [Bacillota bacterium]
MKNKGAFFKIFAVVCVVFVAGMVCFLWISEPEIVGETEIASDFITAEGVETAQLEESQFETSQESSEEQSLSTREISSVEMTFSEACYDGEMLDFYSDYMQPAEGFLCYEDYSHVIGYMLLH